MVTEYNPAEMPAGVACWAALVDCGRPAVNVVLAPTGLRQCREAHHRWHCDNPCASRPEEFYCEVLAA